MAPSRAGGTLRVQVRGTVSENHGNGFKASQSVRPVKFYRSQVFTYGGSDYTATAIMQGYQGAVLIGSRMGRVSGVWGVGSGTHFCAI